MRGLIARILAGQAPAPAGGLAHEIDAAIAGRRDERLAAPPRDERRRFDHARAKVEQLRAEGRF